jgi:hypothetical protein
LAFLGTWQCQTWPLLWPNGQWQLWHSVNGGISGSQLVMGKMCPRHKKWYFLEYLRFTIQGWCCEFSMTARDESLVGWMELIEWKKDFPWFFVGQKTRGTYEITWNDWGWFTNYSGYDLGNHPGVLTHSHLFHGYLTLQWWLKMGYITIW